MKIEPEGESQVLVNYAFDCGLTDNNGMGVVPISWQEIKAWQDITKAGTFVAKFVKQASGVYVNMLHEAKDINTPIPIEAETDRREVIKAVNVQFDNFGS